jgi:hypothetical protein
VHLVGSVGLDNAQTVFATAGKLLGSCLKRVPDGEPGGRRLWITWQWPLLRANPLLEVDPDGGPTGVGVQQLRIVQGVKRELGYAREARASYQDFLRARERGELAAGARFQVSLPTPFAIVNAFIARRDVAVVLPVYEKAMIGEVAAMCAEIPHRDLAIQWDVCIEMVIWDGRWHVQPFPGMEQVFVEMFSRLSSPVPTDVELGFHLCYGDLDAKHFIEPVDATKMTELANLIVRSVKRPIAFIHMPVPIDRDDDAFFAPLKQLRLGEGTELFLGLVHAKDGVAGTNRRIATAKRHVQRFGIATECGMARARTPAVVEELLKVHAAAAASN